MENFKLKKIKAFTSVLFVGIFGTALWELFIKDLIFYLGNLFVSAFSLFYKDYVNSMYNHISSSNQLLHQLPALIIIILFIFFPFIAYLKMVSLQKNYEKLKGNQERFEGATIKAFDYLFAKKIRTRLVMLLIGIPIFLMYVDVLITSVSGSLAYRVVDRNLIIIKPYISNHEYDILQSEFRLIDGKEKLIKLIRKINIVAEKNKIDLGSSRLLALGTVKDIK